MLNVGSVFCNWLVQPLVQNLAPSLCKMMRSAMWNLALQLLEDFQQMRGTASAVSKRLEQWVMEAIYGWVI